MYDAVSSVELDGEARYRVLRMLKGLYYEQFEHGFAEEDTCRLLVESSDISLDQTSQVLNIWELLYFSFTSLTSLQYFFRLVEYPIIGKAECRYLFI